MWRLAALLCLGAVRPAVCRTVQFRNDRPRITTASDYPNVQAIGQIIDSHSNVMVEVNGTFFLYGEYHANGHNEGPSSPLPELSVYTSRDMESWRFRGLLHNNSESWGPVAAASNFWCPDVVWDARKRRMVMYFTNQGAPLLARWGVATSTDGIHFDLVSLSGNSSQTMTGGAVDGNAL